MKSRIVALVDMDCFYCQVEQRLNPELKGKPVAVVQYKKWRGGGIIAVNYEARKFGVTRQMRGNEAQAKCPDIALVHVPENRDKADISKYREAGREVIEVLCQYSNCVERASIDEAYLDLTDAVEQRMLENPVLPSVVKLSSTFVVGYDDAIESEATDAEKDRARELGVATWLQKEDDEDGHKLRLAIAAQLVETMRAAVLTQTGFTCSAGIAHNKILSKLVCGLHKPARQTVLPLEQVPHLYATLPIQKVRSLGGKLGENLVQVLGVTLMADLERFTEAELCQKFDSKTGSRLYNIARGIDNEPVNARLIPKSIGCCKRFPGKTALKSHQEVVHWITELAKEVSERLNKDLEENHRRARNLTVQWSLQIGGSSSSKTGTLSSYDAGVIAEEALHLLNKADTAPQGSADWKPPLQFLGMNVAKFTEEVNKKLSIQNFFKTVNKNETFLSVVNTSKNKESSDVNHASTSNVKSFFLNYPKKSDNMLEDKTNDIDQIEKRDEKEVYKLDSVASTSMSKDSNNAVTETFLTHDIPAKDQVSNPIVSEENGHISYPSAEDDYNSTQDQEAPCPQCGTLVLINDMSDHLDHHIAEELHQELNKGPNMSLEKPSTSVQSGVAKKRKYTKKTTQKIAKTKKIDSFFSHV